MALKVIGAIAFLKEGLAERKWKQVGRLLYDHDKHRCIIVVDGWRTGLFACKPIHEAHPYLAGDVVFPVMYYKRKQSHLWCGFICTTCSAKDQSDTIYCIRLEVMPLTLKLSKPSGLMLTVELEDA